MSSSPTEYMQHILAEANYIIEHASDLDCDEFLSDETLKRAFVRSIEIIGEAAKHIPDSDNGIPKSNGAPWLECATVDSRLLRRGL